MSISEHGAPTEREIQVLTIARAMGGRFDVDGAVNEAEALVACRRLQARGFGDMFVSDRGESFRTNLTGVHWLSDYFAKQAAA